MKFCPQCQTGFSDQAELCPIHGIYLSEIVDLKPGMLIRNTYRIVRKLGQGGMGAVYLADHILLNEPLVLKFLSSELSNDQELSARFLREVRTLRQIHHRNVVHASNLEPAEDGTLFFSMEFVDGPDLGTFVQQSKQPFRVSQALGITRGIAEGLGAAHALGMVHRDIKPENILMAREGEGWIPKIADFGIVANRENSRTTQLGSSMLTPFFAAPEQWLGTPSKELDGRTDLYALGGVLFEMLTGQSAFEADDFLGWAQKHLQSPARPPSHLRPELKDWKGLDGLVLRLLAKDRNQRPANVGEVLRLLDAVTYEPAGAMGAMPAAAQVKAAPAVAVAAPEKVAATGAAASARDTAKKVDAAPIAKAAAKAPEPAPVAAGKEGKAVEAPQAVAEEAVPTGDEAIADEAITDESEPRNLRPIIKKKPLKPAKRSPIKTAFVILVVLAVVGYAVFRIVVAPVHATTLEGNKDAVFAVAFAPNSRLLAAASHDGTLQVWDVNEVKSLTSLLESADSMNMSPDGHTMATGSLDHSIKMWDVHTGQVLGTLQGHTDSVRSVAFSPDNKTLVSGSWDKTVRLWDVASDQVLYTMTGHADQVNAVAYSPDGRTLASGSADGVVKLWDGASGQAMRTIQAHAGAVNGVAFSPDGRTLASAGADTTIKLWDVSDGQLIKTYQGHSAAVNTVAFSANGRLLASGSSDQTIILWDVAGEQQLQTLRGHSGAVLSVSISPDNHLLASGSADKTIKLWGLAGLKN